MTGFGVFLGGGNVSFFPCRICKIVSIKRQTLKE